MEKANLEEDYLYQKFGIRNDYMRVSFCNTNVETIRRGIPILAEAIREVCEN